MQKCAGTNVPKVAAGVGTTRVRHTVTDWPLRATGVQNGGVLTLSTGSIVFESVAISDAEAEVPSRCKLGADGGGAGRRA
jgi:hypothetical protein